MDEMMQYPYPYTHRIYGYEVELCLLAATKANSYTPPILHLILANEEQQTKQGYTNDRCL